MNRFWNWSETNGGRVLTLAGPIAEESWFGDEVTPKLFREELENGAGDVTIWINSPGGDCLAAAQIYNMMVAYHGKVTVKIDGLAASAASVIAMAGDEVQMSPVSMLMIHNPSTLACGDHRDMAKAIEVLETVKDTIINAYALKTGKSRAKLSELMDAETWMDARKAVDMGFADKIIERGIVPELPSNVLFSRKLTAQKFVNKVAAGKPKAALVADLYKLKRFI